MGGTLTLGRQGEWTRKVLADRYRVGRLIARGGMAGIYEASDRDGHEVAVKIMHPHLADGVNVQRFAREADAMGSLRHPNLVEIRSFIPGSKNGPPFMVMERLNGTPLSEVIHQEGPLSPRRVVHIVIQTLSALSIVHKAGVIHRDLKPGNILLIPLADGRELAKVLDFGVAKMAGLSSLTMAGALVGTPSYMSPEQIDGGIVDARSDLYSLGVVMYCALSGRRPFRGKDLGELFTMVKLSPPPPLEALRPDLPEALVLLIERVLSKKREERFATAEEMAYALAPFRRSHSGVVRRVHPPLDPPHTIALEEDTLTDAVASPRAG